MKKQIAYVACRGKFNKLNEPISKNTRGFTLPEVIMALLVSSVSLTVLMTTQGSLVKQAGRTWFSWQNVTIAKNAWYKKKQELYAHGAKAVLAKQSAMKVEERTVTFQTQPLIGKLGFKEKDSEQLIYQLFLDRIQVEGNFFGAIYRLNMLLIIAQEKEQQREEKKGKPS